MTCQILFPWKKKKKTKEEEIITDLSCAELARIVVKVKSYNYSPPNSGADPPLSVDTGFTLDVSVRDDTGVVLKDPVSNAEDENSVLLGVMVW